MLWARERQRAGRGRMSKKDEMKHENHTKCVCEWEKGQGAQVEDAEIWRSYWLVNKLNEKEGGKWEERAWETEWIERVFQWQPFNTQYLQTTTKPDLPITVWRSINESGITVIYCLYSVCGKDKCSSANTHKNAWKFTKNLNFPWEKNQPESANFHQSWWNIYNFLETLLPHLLPHLCWQIKKSFGLMISCRCSQRAQLSQNVGNFPMSMRVLLYCCCNL